MKARLALPTICLLTAATLAQAEDDWAGGFALAEWQTRSVRGAPLNADNFTGIASEQLHLAGLLEGRWQEVSWRLRLETEHNRQDGQHSRSRVQELNRVFTLSEGTSVSVGKRQYSLDQSYVLQPLGFFQKRTDLADPTDSLGQSEGVPMLLFSWVGRRASLAAVYSKDFENPPDGFNRGVEQSLLKLGYEWDGLSAAILLRRASGESTGVGATLSGTLGESFSYYGSVYHARGTPRPIAPELVGEARQSPVQTLDSVRANDGEPYPRAAIGVIFTPRELPRFQLEYAYDRRGLSDAQYRHYLELIDRDAGPQQPALLTQANRATLAQMLIPQGMRRHYLSLSATQTLAGCDLTAGVYTGLADGSQTWYASLEAPLSAHLRFGLAATRQAGGARSERGLSPVAGTLAIRLRGLF